MLLRSETARQFAGFAAIGVLNTLLHLGVVIALVECSGMHPALANGAAFVCANLFSYWANSRFTFRSAPTWRRYGRFAAVSLVGLAVAMLATQAALALHMHYLVGVGVSFMLLPVLSFTANKVWTWRHPD